MDACPECEGTRLARIPRLLLFLLCALLIGAVGHVVKQSDLALAGIVAAGLIAAMAPSHRCLSCGHRFSAFEPDEEAVEAPPPDPSDMIEELCPRCGSPEVHRIDQRRKNALAMLVALTHFILVPFWLLERRKKCDECGLKI